MGTRSRLHTDSILPQPLEEVETGILQRKSSNNSEQAEAPPIVDEVLNSAGQSLDAATRGFFEPRFGRDFSSVRVHTDAKAAQSTQAVGASAYTVGQHIVFGANSYAPETSRGQRLLAHELTHTLQQPKGLPRFAGELKIGRRGEAAEKEADNVSSAVLANNASGANVTRQSDSLQRDEPTAVNPEIAEVSGNKYVDIFTSVHYSLDYRAEGGNLSTWLQVFYPDGTVIDISTYDIKDTTVSAQRGVEMMGQGHIGEGGRIFPLEMNKQTTPRLYAAKKSAIETMEEYNYEFILTTLPAVLFIITMGLGIGAKPVRTTTKLPSVRPKPKINPPKSTAAAVAFNAAKIADDLFEAVKHLKNPGKMMIEAAKILSKMNQLSAAQKVKVILEFFNRIGFAISRQGVTETADYFLMHAEDGRYAFKFMKDSGQIWYGKFDMNTAQYVWSVIQ
jgi:hypothetical protein